MRLAVSVIVLATAALTVPIIELDRKPNGTMIYLAKRSPWLRSRNTVDFYSLDSHINSVDAKMARALENYEKNTGMPHSLAVKGTELLNLEKRAVGTATLTSYEYNAWYCTITVGTPPKSFTVQIDTGFSDLFLPTPTCTGCSGQTLWDPTLSSTAEANGLYFDIEFGDGAACLGNQYADTVTIAGLTADIQTIGAATIYKDMDSIPDGMLGMAFKSLSNYPATPLFETLVNEGKATKPVFSVKLTSDGGELYLGGTNGNLYSGNIIFTPVIDEGFWQVNIQEIGSSNHGTVLRDIIAIIDTGSNMIIGNRLQVINLHITLGGKSLGDGYYSFPCNNFPAIRFSFGGDRMFEIPASILNQGPIDSSYSDCFSGIVDRGNRAHWTLGTVFLETVYAVFDLGNKRVGFANLV